MYGEDASVGGAGGAAARAPDVSPPASRAGIISAASRAFFIALPVGSGVNPSVEQIHFSGGEPEVGRPAAVARSLDAPATRDGDHHVGLRELPGERDLVRRHAASFSHLLEGGVV